MDDNKVMNLNIVRKYEDVMVEGLHHSYPMLKESELREAVEDAILKNYKDSPIELDNNYTKKLGKGSLIDILGYIQSKEPIVTSSGVLFKKHKDSVNPLSEMIMGFLNTRKQYKKEMFKHPKGSEEFEKYNLLQLLEKLNANATYGVLGAPTSMYYNIHVAEAITRQARSYISCGITFFESFFANNVKFNNLNEIITFLHNIVSEKSDRKYHDSDILKRPITVEECFYKVINTCDITGDIYVPSEEDMARVWEYLRELPQEDINRIYYKNNLYSFIDDSSVEELIIQILSSLKDPYIDPYSPPEYIVNDLEELTNILREYVYYGYVVIDKLDRINYMQRDIVAISDTDSTIISLDAWYHYILDKVYDLNIPIKRQLHNMVSIIERDEWGDPIEPKIMCKVIEPRLDYDFYTDEIIEEDRSINPCDLIPQDNLRFAIINIISYVCTTLSAEFVAKYCKQCGSEREGVKCLMSMKNEFLFARVLLTTGQRNYADIQELQEGTVIPKGKNQMAIMGLPINKSTLSDDIRSKMQHILFEDILTTTVIDQKQVMKDLIILEKEIYSSIMAGETKYYKPDNVAPMKSYDKDPYSINGVLAIIIYNKLKDDNMPAINTDERNRIMKIKINVNKQNVNKIKDAYPDTYNKLIELLNDEKLGSKVKVMALPVDTPVPKWILEFVDFTAIVNDQLKNFPLESIGLTRLGNDNVNISNIIQL